MNPDLQRLCDAAKFAEIDHNIRTGSQVSDAAREAMVRAVLKALLNEDWSEKSGVQGRWTAIEETVNYILAEPAEA